MNREDIIRMAQEAQMPFYWRTGEITYLDKLERFAAIVASAEREACARLCELMWHEWLDSPEENEPNRPDAEDCYRAIRKRSHV